MIVPDLTASSLDDPLYYLRNVQQVVEYCRTRYADLLLPSENQRLGQFSSLETTTQALLVRLVMRKGTLYRNDNLAYAEIPDLQGALQSLSTFGFIDSRPALLLKEVCVLSKREECLRLARHCLPEKNFSASTRKSDLMASLISSQPEDSAKPLLTWWPDAPYDAVQLKCGDLFDRLRLMFFGNLHQTWAEFVVTELGLQQFEAVPLSAESRPFLHRAEVDLYLQLHQLRERVAGGEPVESVSQALPEATGSEWVDYRRQKVLFQLGRDAERQHNPHLALELYHYSQHRDARVRSLRLLEKREEPASVFRLAKAALAEIPQPEIHASLRRILQRTARKAGLAYSAPSKADLPVTELVLPMPDRGRVESAVISHLATADTELFHVENRLFNGLFGLLFWPALFAPVRGAFFNPFQSGPADLYRPGFCESRADEIADAFQHLRTGSYRDVIHRRLVDKRGISCSFVHWPTLTPELVEPALDIIPARHLETVFQHLLVDLRHHRRGMPDLIELDLARGSYRLIEVKGPGDRLQDHQRLWIDAMLAHGLPVSVCTVRWEPK